MEREARKLERVSPSSPACRSAARGVSCLAGKRAPAGTGAAFTLEHTRNRSRAPGIGLPVRVSSAFCIIPPSLHAGPLFGLASGRWPKFDTGASCFGKADGNGLLGAARTMFTFPNVMYLLADKFSGLSGR